MDDTLSFRNKMAESGYEYTPEQAAHLMRSVENFRQQIFEQSSASPEEYENLRDLTHNDKQNICDSFYEDGRIITVLELDKIIDLVLHIYDEEKMF